MYDKIKQQHHGDFIIEALMESLPDLIFVKNNDGVYVQCNQAFSEFVGKPREDIIGKTDYDFFPKTIADFFRRHDKAMIAAGEPKRNEEWVSYPDGRRILLDTLKMPMGFGENEPCGVIGVSRDITRTQEIESQSVEVSQRYRAILQSTIDGFWRVDRKGHICEVNDAYCQMSGYSAAELTNMRINELDCFEKPEETLKRIEKIIAYGGDIFEAVHRRKDGSRWDVEVSISYSAIEGGCFFSFFRDISERKLNDELSTLRNRLSGMIYSEDMIEILRTGLDLAEKLTFSSIGFFHFVDKDEENVSLQAWSTRTLNEMCYAKGEGLHYPVSKAGVWVDCIHSRMPVIHNDYDALKHKKGMPDGHPALIRELTVPLVRNGKVVAVIGLGNKEDAYVDGDIRIVRDIANLTFEFAERKRVEQQIQFMAYNDLLTNLPNRQLFSDRLKQAIAHSKRSDEILAVCYLDLDGFKPINDQHGHEIGDRLLIAFAQRMQGELREEDTLARIGGDEFAIILNGLNDISGAEEVVDRLLKRAASPFDVEGLHVHVSASIGITCYPLDMAEPEVLLRHADQAMYKAKEKGKNAYVLYDPILNQRKLTHDKVIAEFRDGLQNGQLELYYQPRIDLQCGEFAGVEALVRWHHPKRGFLLPGSFLPYIEGMAEEIALDEWVIRKAITQHLIWKEQGLNLPISVNITPRHLQQMTFPQYLKDVLSEFPQDVAQFLELEILEVSAISDTGAVAEIMRECSKLGICFALDDFGTGYSSLTYFHSLPIEILKIDQNFVRSMIENPEDQNIVEGVLRLADSISRPVVAEGIETEELGYMLRQLGCKYAQGFAIAKPMPADEVFDWSVRWQTEPFWVHVQEELSQRSGDYELNVALFTCEHWLDKIDGKLRTNALDAKGELDEMSKHFSQWYHGVGAQKYGTREQYPFILAKHNNLCRLMSEKIVQAQERDLDQQDFEALEVATRDFMDILLKLEVKVSV